MSDDEPHLNKTDARAGATPHMTRPILLFSLVLVIAVFAVIAFVWGL